MSLLVMLFISDVGAFFVILPIVLFFLVILYAVLKKLFGPKGGLSTLSLSDAESNDPATRPVSHRESAYEPANYEDPPVEEEVDLEIGNYMHEPVAVPPTEKPLKKRRAEKKRVDSDVHLPIVTSDEFAHEGEDDLIDPALAADMFDVGDEYDGDREAGIKPVDESEFPEYSGLEQDATTVEFMGAGAGGSWEETESHDAVEAEIGAEVNIPEPEPASYESPSYDPPSETYSDSGDSGGDSGGDD